MEKYRLKKIYPGSPPIGTILTGINFISECSCVYMSNNMLYVESSNRVENQPEYWEKVEEMPKYVKLIQDSAWKVPKGAVCKVIKENDICGNIFSNQWLLENIYIPNNMNCEGKYQFYIVKEDCIPATKEEYEAQEGLFVTNDGVEIHKGDNYWWINKRSDNHSPIGVKAYGKKEEYSKCKDDYYLFSTEQAAKDFIKSLRKPLFTTEDGVDIFEGDSYWYVTTNFFIDFMGRALKGSGEQTTIKYFSTKEKAKKYLDLNKPIYSKKDIKLIQFNTIYEFYMQSIDFLEKNNTLVLNLNDLDEIKKGLLKFYNL